ncbi:hypothetical protein PL321_07055 [Caloramator sp. mosi_1]|uniref:hypothetical protein n=1 Tax=Caloramator sp. mosi_1 TaxID=3023090 RepID=UPI00235E5BFE|nr:hypothetical protein [Caloramator sp. mosi_1]WDC85213.1 hypothetical protein PL321_07055 [Caloramator sp. mosi_1]
MYTYSNIDFPITLEVFKNLETQVKDIIDERTLYRKEYNNKSIFVRVEENKLEIEFHKNV